MRRLLVVLFFAFLAGCSPGATPAKPSPDLGTATPPPVPTATRTPTPTPTLVGTPSPTASRVQALVTRVIDGDTIEVQVGGMSYRVRYIGVDTPELTDTRSEVRALALEATQVNERLVGRKTVSLEKDISETDRYDRLLRYVYVGELFVNAELVRLGYAQVATYPPDVKYQGLFLEMEREARLAGRGLWATPAAAPTSLPTPTPAPTITPTPTPDTTPGLLGVQIIHIFYDGRVPQTEADEYVEIKNLGDMPVNLKGWVLNDVSDGYPSFTFPDYTLQPGGTIRVYTNEVHPEWGGFSFGYPRAIWNNTSPDVAALYDAQGQEVSRRSY